MDSRTQALPPQQPAAIIAVLPKNRYWRRTKEARDDICSIISKKTDTADGTIKMVRQVLEAESEQLSKAVCSTVEAAEAVVDKVAIRFCASKKGRRPGSQVSAGDSHIPDRLFIIHGPDARLIQKGKLKAHTELGYKLNLGECEERIVMSYQLLTGNQSDEFILEQCVDEHIKTVGGTTCWVGYGIMPHNLRRLANIMQNDEGEMARR